MRNLLIILAMSALTLSGCVPAIQILPVSDPPPTSAAQQSLDLPATPAFMISLVDQKAGAYVSGGWGRSRGDAVVFRHGDEPYDFIALEYYLMASRDFMDLTRRENLTGYAVLAERLRFKQSLLQLDGKLYDLLEYSFIAAKPEDADRALAILGSSASPAEIEKQLEVFAKICPREFWFEITEAFDQFYAEMP